MSSLVDFDGTWVDALDSALDDRYARALPEELELAVERMLGSLEDGEAVNFSKALRTVGKAAQQQVGGSSLAALAPVVGTAAGTAVGGPVGGALGRSVGKSLAPSLGGRQRQARPAAVAAGGVPANGSAAAAQALMLVQSPEVLQALLALSLGAHGRREVRIPSSPGSTPQAKAVPVSSVMRMLRGAVAQAADDADELDYVERGTPFTTEWDDDSDQPFEQQSHRLYHLLMARAGGPS